MPAETVMLEPRSLVWMCAPLVIAGAALAQGGLDHRASPLDAATASRADAPATITPAPKTDDPEIERVMGLLSGSFAADGAGDRPALRFNACPIAVHGLDNAVYFEITRADSPAAAFRQGVFHAYRRQGELRLRVFDLAGPPADLKEALTGLWAAPDAMPALDVSQLDPNLDLVLSRTATGWNGATPYPYPTARDGAVEMTATIALGPDEVRMRDAGYAPDGAEVWGGGSAAETVFKKAANPGVKALRMDDGVIVITLVPPPADAPKLVENGQVSVQYTGWLADGTRFDTSRQPGRNPFTLRVPGPVIKGWNEGLAEIARGERRRLIIPAAMAYGDRGTRDGRIPPHSTLIFDVECVHLDNTPPSTPAVPTPPSRPAPAGAATPSPPTPKGTPGSAASPDDGADKPK